MVPRDNFSDNRAMQPHTAPDCPTAPWRPPHRVTVLALDGCKPFDLGIPAQVFGHAFEEEDGEPQLERPLYEVTTCSLGGRPVTTNQDFTVAVTHDESALLAADTVVIATQDGRAPLPGPGELSDELAAALANLDAATRVVSLCTSAFILAAAGMLDGQQATTHWALCHELAHRFPAVDVQQSVMFVDNGRILTSAGAAAGIDLCLHLIRLDHGSAVANQAARRCVVAPWREGGQAQYLERPLPRRQELSTAETRRWTADHLSEALSLDELARHARMSTRTFTRRFREEVGQSPQQWLLQRRLDYARHLLEATDLSIAEVARTAGFGDPLLLRKHLRTYVGMTPSAYRQAYSATRRDDAEAHVPA